MRKCVLSVGRMIAVAAGLSFLPAMASASPYTVSYWDNTAFYNWNTVYAQGFSTSLIDDGTAPSPTPSVGGTVYLTQFQFYKSGNSDGSSNIQLAIFGPLSGVNTTGLSTSTPGFVGLSNNIIASTASLATYTPEAFTFTYLPLIYGNDYSAIAVNVGAGGALTPVLISSWTGEYTEDTNPSDPTYGDYLPTANYSTNSDYDLATTNSIGGSGYFNEFSYGGDAAFAANLDTVPEPASLGMLGFSGIALLVRRRKQTAK